MDGIAFKVNNAIAKRHRFYLYITRKCKTLYCEVIGLIFTQYL